MTLQRRLVDAIAQHKTAAVTMVIGLIAGPIVGVTLNDYINITPKRLAGLLEDDKVSVLEQVLLNITKDSKAKAKVLEFNELRKQFKQPITLESLDLSNKTLTGVNLDSVIILHSNLSNINLGGSSLRNADLSNADLSNANLTHADLFTAKLAGALLPNANLTNAILHIADLTNSDLRGIDLTGAELFRADLTNTDLRGATLANADLSLTNLRESLFDCTSLRTANSTVNASQIHIVDSLQKEVSSC
jgi:uncharacterized protein YjbI with pentapeptide repeats